MINQENIEIIYQNILNEDINDINDIIKIIMYDISYDVDFLISKKLFKKHNSIILEKNSDLIFQLLIAKKYNIFQYLIINFQINTTFLDKNGNNILHYLSINNLSINNFNLLSNIEFISMSNHRNFENKTPLHYAISNKNYELTYRMIDVFNPIGLSELNELIILCAKKFNLTDFKKIIEKFKFLGLTINDVILYNDNNNKNALSQSLKYKNFDIAYFLLKNGVIFYNNMDVAMLITENISDIKILKMLFNNGINVNKRNENFDHPIIFLIINRFINPKLKIKIISLFLEHGLNINTRDIFENNFLHYCILYKENHEVISYLNSLNIIDNMNVDNINSEDLKNNDKLREKYICRINNLYN